MEGSDDGGIGALSRAGARIAPARELSLGDTLGWSPRHVGLSRGWDAKITEMTMMLVDSPSRGPVHHESSKNFFEIRGILGARGWTARFAI